MKTQLVVKILLTAAVLLLCCQSGFVQAKVIFVDIRRPAGGDGTTWQKAYSYLQDALTAAVSGDSICVANGIYKPDQGNGLTPGDRSASFRLKEGVAILGGYAGYNAPYPDEHNTTKNKTILSGDLNWDDEPNFTNYADNSYNVVICDNINQYTKINGFTITGGNAEGTYPYNRGGGMLINNNSSVGVLNCILSDNMAQHAGGGLYSMNGSSPVVENCIFNGNKAQNVGGGMQDAGGSSTLINCIFYKNVTVDSPGWGGGLRVYNSNTTVTNCIFLGNSAASGNQIAVDNASTASISYSDIEGGQSAIYIPDGDGSTITWGSGNIDADPLFEDVTQGNYHLRKGSPCVDAGTKTGASSYDYEESPRLSSAGGDDKPDIGVDELIVREVGRTGYPYNTIQAAIDAAQTGDLVLVHNGTYVENIDFKGKAIRLRSENGATETTIDGNQSGSVVTLRSIKGTQPILDGFSITNGNKNGDGGGIYCDDTLSATITKCIIKANTADRKGGGIAVYNSQSPSIKECTIKDNHSSDNGGGVFCQTSTMGNIINCIVTKNNSGKNGGGIEGYSASQSITNCTITGNSAATFGGGLHCDFFSNTTVINSIFWSDIANGIANEITLDQGSEIIITYSDIEGGWMGQGNINSDPLFKNAANGDYHLLSGSPCIDAANSDGAPTTDINGNIRYDDPQTTNTGAGALPYYDMGAIEYQGIVATTTTTASGGGGGGGGGGGNTTTTTASANTTTTVPANTTTTVPANTTTTTAVITTTTTSASTGCQIKSIQPSGIKIGFGLLPRIRRVTLTLNTDLESLGITCADLNIQNAPRGIRIISCAEVGETIEATILFWGIQPGTYNINLGECGSISLIISRF